MDNGMLFYCASVAVSLYVAYIFSFRTYKLKDRYSGHPYVGERYTFPRIVYMLMIVACFLPLFNAFCCVLFITVATIGNVTDEFRIKSWLFEKPGDNRQEEEKE